MGLNDKPPITFTLHFPNESDGTTEVNVQELKHLVNTGHVKIKAQQIRAVTMQFIADTYIREEKPTGQDSPTA